MMYKNENGVIDKREVFREQIRKDDLVRFEKQKQLRAEQAERMAAETEAAKLPEHEEMKNLTDKAKVDMWKLQSGDINAAAKMRRAILDVLTVLQYMLAKTETQAEQSGSGG